MNCSLRMERDFSEIDKEEDRLELCFLYNMGGDWREQVTGIANQVRHKLPV